MKSVNEVCKLSGVSRRTLQYYDEIGLLTPSAVKESGYRLYDDESLRRLWSILFYKKLGIALGEIRLLLESPKELEKELMLHHKEVLLEKQDQLQKMIRSVDSIIHDKFDILMLRDFERNRIENLKKSHANEMRVLKETRFFLPVVKSGILQGRISSVKNVSNIMNLDFDKLVPLCVDIIQKFSLAMKDGPESMSAKETVMAFRELLEVWIPCDATTLRTVGQSYLNCKEELDIKSPGLAEFIYAAIMHNDP